MSRLAAVRPGEATPEQREVIDAIAGGDRGRDRPIGSLLDKRGGLAGPFNAWVHRPDLGSVIQRPGIDVPRPVGVAVREGSQPVSSTPA